MTWKVRLHEDFQQEFFALEESVQDEILATSLARAAAA